MANNATFAGTCIGFNGILDVVVAINQVINALKVIPPNIIARKIPSPSHEDYDHDVVANDPYDNDHDEFPDGMTIAISSRFCARKTHTPIRPLYPTSSLYLENPYNQRTVVIKANNVSQP